MSQSALTPEIQYRYYLLIPQATNTRILLLPVEADHRLTLPHFATSEPHDWQGVDHINQAMHALLGLHVTTLRCISTAYDAENNQHVSVYAMENQDPDWSPPGSAGWYGRDGLAVVLPEQRPILEAWFDRVEFSANPLRVPWYNRGWFHTAMTWINAQLERLGYGDYAHGAAIRQLRTWEGATVWQIATAAGNIYFKAVPDMFRHEPVLTAWLSKGFPSKFPIVLNIEAEHGWMLIRDIEGESLVRISDPARWSEMLGVFSQMQADLVIDVDGLKESGCPNRRLERIADDVGALLEDIPAMLPGAENGLSEREIETLRRYGPQLRAMCEELEECHIPYTLEHGDFSPGQVMLSNRGYVFFDWSHSSISHPFFSFNMFLETLDKTPLTVDDEALLHNAYLEPWRSYTTPERLERAVTLARPLAALHSALLYHRLILPWVEAKWEVEARLPFYLKRLLHHLGERPDTA